MFTRRRLIFGLIIVLVIVGVLLALAAASAPPTTQVELPPSRATQAPTQVMQAEATPEATAEASNRAETTPEATVARLTLPRVSGQNIDGDAVTLPDDLAGRFNLIVMPFTRDQQANAVDWLPIFQEIAATYADVAYYSVAALPDLNFFGRTGVMLGLSAGVQDAEVRQASVVLFLADQAGFVEALDLPNTDVMQVLILNAEGAVLWQVGGGRTDARAEQLRQAFATVYSSASGS